jgi:hypothetical protein
MAERDRSRKKEDEVYRKHHKEKGASCPFGPWEIPKKGFSVCPDKSEIKQRQGNVKNGDKNGSHSFLMSQFLLEFRHLSCQKQETCGMRS